MAKTLTGAVLTDQEITVFYVENGEPGQTNGPWSAGITTAVNTLRGLIDTALGETAYQVQIYTTLSDPNDSPNASAGDIIDAWHNGGNPTTRFGGEIETPTGAMNAARNALKSVLQAAL